MVASVGMLNKFLLTLSKGVNAPSRRRFANGTVPALLLHDEYPLAMASTSAAAAVAVATTATYVPSAPLPEQANAFCHTWTVVRTENYDAYLQQLGLSYLTRLAVAAITPEPTMSIVDGKLQGVTRGVLGTSVHDDFSTGHERSISFAGYDTRIRYDWEEDAQTRDFELVARCRSPKLADGDVFTIRRRVDSATGELIARSTVRGVSYTRCYRAVQREAGGDSEWPRSTSATDDRPRVPPRPPGTSRGDLYL